MKCIGYDAQWLAGLVHDYPAWKDEYREKIERRKQQRELARGDQPTLRRTKKPKEEVQRTGTKRKAAGFNNSEIDYVPKGTRRRPFIPRGDVVIELTQRRT